MKKVLQTNWPSTVGKTTTMPTLSSPRDIICVFDEESWPKPLPPTPTGGYVAHAPTLIVVPGDVSGSAKPCIVVNPKKSSIWKLDAENDWRFGIPVQ